MDVYVNATIAVAPVAVYWEQDGDHCQVFFSERDGKNFYVENNLWKYNGLIWSEGGQPIPPPAEPTADKES